MKVLGDAAREPGAFAAAAHLAWPGLVSTGSQGHPESLGSGLGTCL